MSILKISLNCQMRHGGESTSFGFVSRTQDRRFLFGKDILSEAVVLFLEIQQRQSKVIKELIEDDSGVLVFKSCAVHYHDFETHKKRRIVGHVPADATSCPGVCSGQVVSSDGSNILSAIFRAGGQDEFGGYLSVFFSKRTELHIIDQFE